MFVAVNFIKGWANEYKNVYKYFHKLSIFQVILKTRIFYRFYSAKHVKTLGSSYKY